MRIVISILLMGFLGACENHQTQTSGYFDTKTFFLATTGRLSAHNYRLDKTLFFGDSVAKQQLKIVNWETELRPFTEIDLHKKAYRGRFRIDSVYTQDNLMITYHTTDDKTDLKKITLKLREPDRSVLYVNAFYGATNKLYEASKELTYYADSLFIIKGVQKVQFGNNVHYEVRGQINAGQ